MQIGPRNRRLVLLLLACVLLIACKLTAPTLQSPQNDSSDMSPRPTLTWAPVRNASGYSLQVSTDASFAHPVVDISDFAATSRQVGPLDNYTTYYWRTRASSATDTSDWSHVWRFTTRLEPCGAPFAYAGKIYNTVQIGTQCWMKENLDVGTQIQGTQVPQNNQIIEKYCFNNDPGNCATYGGLYLWSEALQYQAVSGVQGVCPNGWRMPTKGDLETLFNVGARQDARALKAVGAGDGTNTTGFSALLAGLRTSGGNFGDFNNFAFFQSSTEEPPTAIWIMQLRYSNDYPSFVISISDKN